MVQIGIASICAYVFLSRINAGEDQATALEQPLGEEACGKRLPWAS